MVVIIWLLVLQLHMRSVHIITKVVSSIPAQDEVYLIQHYVIKFVSFFMAGRGLSLGTPASSTNKTNRHYITEILLKNLALNIITLNHTESISLRFSSDIVPRRHLRQIRVI